MGTKQVIRVENLSKSYRLGQIGTGTLSNDLKLWWAKTRGKPNPLLKIGQEDHGNRDGEELWALRDVSFTVDQGEVLGIIGRNGAGKSTLLKILSRVTAPTSGLIKVRGRIASLLEVGTGFHPELTGRENIYLNGAILGMSHEEVRRKFDEIVAFAEVEKFIDTPVKRYSSGMYVRLAFAVAAHLDPEILLVDEVLAVGDAEFQKKCLGKMGEVARKGRTVLFVSHNMAAVSNLCTTCMLLKEGCVSALAQTDEIIEYYRRQAISRSADDNLSHFRPSWAHPYITWLRVINQAGEEQYDFPIGSDLTFEMGFDCSKTGLELHSPVMGIVIHHSSRGTVGGVNTRMSGYEVKSGDYQKGVFRGTLSKIPLLQGQYTIDIWLGDRQVDLDAILGHLTITIHEADVYRSGKAPFQQMGVIYFDPCWDFNQPS